MDISIKRYISNDIFHPALQIASFGHRSSSSASASASASDAMDATTHPTNLPLHIILEIFNNNNKVKQAFHGEQASKKDHQSVDLME